MRKFYTGVITLFMAFGLALALPSAASAEPSDCTIAPQPAGQVKTMGVSCTSGTGEYRMVIWCNTGQSHNSPTYWVYGPWRAVGTGWSIASCGHHQMRGLHVEKRG
jgi:hypothetical protein